ncbi:MAG: hypothetical protein RL582_322 [Bacteroidota bacterium]
MMKNILISGGTGLVGKELTAVLLERGYDVVILTRSKTIQSNNPRIKYAHWNIENRYIDPNALHDVDAIIHLAGAGVVEKRWSDSYKKEIEMSRTESSAILMNALSTHEHNVKTFISTSAIGWYGPDSIVGKPFSEDAPANEDFLGKTCKAWEESVYPCKNMGIRLCIVRTGIVLSKNGGALKEFLKPIKMGVAAILGNGKQIISWIHIRDLCNLYIHLMEKENLNGVFNGVAPTPVSNKNLTISLASCIRKTFFIPIHVPAFMLKIIMGESSIEVLKSTTVDAKKISASGFTFIYPTLMPALREITSRA